MKKSHIRKLLKAGADMLSSLSRPSSMLNFNIMDNFFHFQSQFYSILQLQISTTTCSIKFYNGPIFC